MIRRLNLLRNLRKKILRSLNRVLVTLIVALTTNQGLITEAICQSVDINADLAADKNELLQNTAQRLYVRSKVIEDLSKGPFSVFSYTPPLPIGETSVFGVLDLPITRITHPGNISTARTTTRVDSKFQFNAQHQFEVTKLSFMSAADFDRYDHTAAANGNGLLSSLKWEFNKLKDPRIDPYLLYQSSLAFTTDFGTTKSRLNDVGAGIKFKQTKPGAIGEDITWSASLDMNATRRSANSGANSDSYLMKPSFVFSKGKDVSAIFAPSLRTRWFDSGRRDRTVILPVQVAWQPKELAKLHGEVQFALTGSRNFSTVPSKQTRQWEIGPTIELVFEF